MYPINR